MLNYNSRKVYVKTDNKWLNVEVSKDTSYIEKMLLEDLYWNYIVKAGHIKRIIHDSNTIIVYHSNGYKTVYSK